jgi:hypothetical protein
MSRNLCRSICCDNIVRLSDLRGKPIEFRRYSDEPPAIGTRWDCPTCDTAYFAWWRDGVWDSASGNGWARGFVIDLSYYDTFNDEHYPPYRNDDPSCLCLDNAEDRQEVW